MSEAESRLSQTALFTIPIWHTDLPEVVRYHDEMADQVESLIDSQPGRPGQVLAQQTEDDPFRLPSPGWPLLESLTNDLYRELAATSFQRWRSGEFHVRRWAIRLGRLDDDEKSRLERDRIHNHLPALFSTIYYLSVPDELEGVRGGTRFWNPIGNLMDVTAPRLADVPAKEGRLIIFPSFLDHAPLPIAWDAKDRARIVVSSDLFYISGHADTAAHGQVVPAAGQGGAVSTDST